MMQSHLFTALLALMAVDAQNLRSLNTDGEVFQFGSGPPDKDYVATGFSQADVVGGDMGIIGGDNVVPGSLPFYGHFQGATMCGGALVHEDIFVTAAHCLEGGFPATVRIGATTTTSSNEGQEVAVCAGLIHPNNNMKSMQNDIAVLKLCDPVFVNSYASYNSDPGVPAATGEDLYIIGFGRTNPTGNLSPFLKKAKVDYLNSETCTARYGKYDPTQALCADAPAAGICYGDSGGPLLDENNKLIGLASFIIDTCASSYPDFFTRISSYSSWLDQQVCSQAINPPMDCATTAQGDGGDEGDGDTGDEESALTECLDLVLELLGSLTEGIRAGVRYVSDGFQ